MFIQNIREKPQKEYQDCNYGNTDQQRQIGRGKPGSSVRFSEEQVERDLDIVE